MTDPQISNEDYETRSHASRDPHYWIFQPISPDFSLPEIIALKAIGDEDEWPAIRNGGKMRAGDQAMFYQMRTNQGVYACGELLSAPYDQRQLEGPYSGTGLDGEQVVRVRYTRILPRPFDRTEMARHPDLSTLHMVRVSDCINCPVTPAEWLALQKLVRKASAPRFWWVNQGLSFDRESTEGYIRSPQLGAGGQSVQAYKNLTLVRPGDMLLHYAQKEVRAVGEVKGSAQETTIPDAADRPPDTLGWMAQVDVTHFEHAIELEEIPPDWRMASAGGGPFNHQGGVNQGYLFPLNSTFMHQFVERFGDRLPAWVTELQTEGELPQPDRTILKVAPGRDAMYWHECLNGGFICVGWEELPDLTAYNSEDAIRAAWLERGDHQHAGTARIFGRALWAYRNLKPGDLIVANRGQSSILAVGEVIGGYEYRAERQYYKHVVPVRWDTSLARSIPDQGPAWRHTIVELRRDQYRDLIGSALPGDGPPVGLPNGYGFDRIITDLRQNGLYFSGEAVSNYLLALQAKRFAILTGISGTGKTQLALATARHFQPVIHIARPMVVPEDAVELEVRPYMLKHNRTVLPAALLSHLELPPPDPETGAVVVTVRFDGREAPLRVSSMGPGNAKEILFKGEFKKWFATTLKLGDRFLLRPWRAGEASVDAVEIVVPETATRTETLPNYRIIAVRPDWTDNRGLLGYYNPITETYATTDFLRLLLDAQADVLKAQMDRREPFPFFAILDEMNLARVEHYFSDFLSALESGEEIELHHSESVEAGEVDDAVPVPRRLRIPPNVFFSGTVNVDETTYMFSPKVLDRAFTIEFNEVDLRSFGGAAGPKNESIARLRLTRLPPTLQQLPSPALADWNAFSNLADGELRRVVIELNDLLEASNRQFGYRVANEIGRFVRLAAEQSDGSTDSLWVSLDLAILQKVLPKFHGTQQELEGTLEDLLAFAVLGSSGWTKEQQSNAVEGWRLLRGALVSQKEQHHLDIPRLPRTAAKAWRMLDRMRKQGFTAYVE